MSQMVNSLMKLGLPQGASLENRRLAIDLAALVVHWEKQRLHGPAPEQQPRKRPREDTDLKVQPYECCTFDKKPLATAIGMCFLRLNACRDGRFKMHQARQFFLPLQISAVMLSTGGHLFMHSLQAFSSVLLATMEC